MSASSCAEIMTIGWSMIRVSRLISMGGAEVEGEVYLGGIVGKRSIDS